MTFREKEAAIGFCLFSLRDDRWNFVCAPGERAPPSPIRDEGIYGIEEKVSDVSLQFRARWFDEVRRSLTKLFEEVWRSLTRLFFFRGNSTKFDEAVLRKFDEAVLRKFDEVWRGLPVKHIACRTKRSFNRCDRISPRRWKIGRKTREVSFDSFDGKVTERGSSPRVSNRCTTKITKERQGSQGIFQEEWTIPRGASNLADLVQLPAAEIARQLPSIRIGNNSERAKLVVDELLLNEHRPIENGRVLSAISLVDEGGPRWENSSSGSWIERTSKRGEAKEGWQRKFETRRPLEVAQRWPEDERGRLCERSWATDLGKIEPGEPSHTLCQMTLRRVHEDSADTSSIFEYEDVIKL